MSKRSPREQINKATWTLMQGIKDTLQTNLAAASSQGKLDIKGDSLARLLLIVNASIEEGYHRGSRVHDKVVDKALEDAEAAELRQYTTQTSLPSLGAPTPKKSRA